MPPRRKPLDGVLNVPGDKSITHRALMFAALAPGKSHLNGALMSLDTRSTAKVLRALGTTISPMRQGKPIEVIGQKRFSPPSTSLDCGNSGTTARLMMGLLAAHSFTAEISGDKSLKDRPMRRITEPLGRMGAKFGTRTDTLPIEITGAELTPIQWQMEVASAQVKSAILLAGMAGEVAVMLTQPRPSRDHTERLLRRFGYLVEAEDTVIHFAPTGAIEPFDQTIPGDPSSAAFVIGAALLSGAGEVSIGEVCCNHGRIGWVDVLARMNSPVEVTDLDEQDGEPVGTLTGGEGALEATDIDASEVPGVIDEIPLLACLAARAAGKSTFRGLGELRVKESDRLQLLETNLKAVGVKAKVKGDELTITGASKPPAGKVKTGGDHRIAMAFRVLGMVPKSKIELDDPDCADVSYPGFDAMLEEIGRRAK